MDVDLTAINNIRDELKCFDVVYLKIHNQECIFGTLKIEAINLKFSTRVKHNLNRIIQAISDVIMTYNRLHYSYNEKDYEVLVNPVAFKDPDRYIFLFSYQPKNRVHKNNFKDTKM
jgi:hypothetical protein